MKTSLTLSKLGKAKEGIRKKDMLSAIALSLSFLLFAIFLALSLHIRWVFWFGLFGFAIPVFYRLKKYSLREIALGVGKEIPELKERLLAVLSFVSPKERKLYSQEIMDAYIKESDEKLKNIEISTAIKRRLYFISPLLLVCAILINTFYFCFSPLHYKLGFYYVFLYERLPLQIKPIVADTLLKEGSELEVKAKVLSPFPIRNGQIILIKESKKYEYHRVGIEDGVLAKRIKVKEPLKVIFEVLGKKTKPIEIWLIAPLKIEDMTFHFKFPAYSGLSNYTTTSTNWNVLKGTEVRIEGRSSLPLTCALLRKKDSIFELNVDKREFMGTIRVMEAGKMELLLKAISDSLILPLETILIEDSRPFVEIFLPGEDVSMPDKMLLQLGIYSVDDYGLSRLEIYAVKEDTHCVFKRRLDGNSDTTFYLFDLSGFSLFPGDKLSYYAVVWDNDAVSSPKPARSKVYWVRFPTMEEIYQDVTKYTEYTSSELSYILDKQEELEREIERITQKLRTERSLSYPEKQKLYKTITQQVELFSQAQKLSEITEKLFKKLDEGIIWDRETIEEMREISRLLSEILPDSLKEKLMHIADEIKKNPEILETKLKELASIREELKRNLKQTLNILRKYLQEKKLEELSQKLKLLEKAQEEIIKNLNKIPQDSVSKLQQTIEKGLKEVEKATKELAKELEEDEIAGELEKLAEEIDKEGLGLSYNARQNLNNISKAKELLSKLKRKMGEWANQFSSLSSLLKEKRREGIAQEMLTLSRELIQASQVTEEIIKEMEASAMSGAEKMNNLRRALRKHGEKLVSLGGESFMIPKEALNNLIKAEEKAAQSLDALIEGDKDKGKKYAEEAKSKLDKATLSLLSAFKKCVCPEGSSTGIEELMEALSKLAFQQLSLNQQLRGILPIPIPSQLSQAEIEMLGEILRKQQSIRKKLEELKEEAGNTPGLTGRLDGIIEDMKKTEEDLAKLNLPRELIKRQERIFRRLLDAKRSLRKKEEEKKRWREIGKEFENLVSPQLPENKGERMLFLKKELMNAMEKDYPPEYKILIRSYFKKLLEE